jgi:hypothetical protein
MKLILALIIAVMSTGCSTVMNGVASYYDSQDACQSKNWPENGGKMNMGNYTRGPSGYPNFCGASGNSVRVSSYVKSNGTVVRSHYRSAPDGNPYNNYSYSR